MSDWHTGFFGGPFDTRAPTFKNIFIYCVIFPTLIYSTVLLNSLLMTYFIDIKGNNETVYHTNVRKNVENNNTSSVVKNLVLNNYESFSMSVGPRLDFSKNEFYQEK